MTLTHITISTAKLEESIQFYQTAVGLIIAQDLRTKSPLNIVFLTDTNQTVNIELIENKEHPYEGSGLSIGFATADLDNEAERLKQAGMTSGPVISPNPHTRFFFISDPNGVQIQFIEEK